MVSGFVRDTRNRPAVRDQAGGERVALARDLSVPQDWDVVREIPGIAKPGDVISYDPTDPDAPVVVMTIHQWGALRWLASCQSSLSLRPSGSGERPSSESKQSSPKLKLVG